MSGRGSRRWSRDEVLGATVRVLREARGSRPEVRLVRCDGELAVVKDYAVAATRFKRVMGAYLIRREAVALRRAATVPNVPRLLAIPTPCALVMSYVDAVALRSPQAPPADERYFSLLSEMVARLHAAGVAHGDLEKLDNILITPTGEPAIVDFTSAIMSGANPLAAMALPEVMDNDRRAICKLKAEYAPHLLTPAEEEFLRTRGQLETWFRSWREYIRHPAQWLSGERAER